MSDTATATAPTPRELARYLTARIRGCAHEPEARVGEEYVCRENASFAGCDYQVVCRLCGAELARARECLSQAHARAEAAEAAERLRRDPGIDFNSWDGFGRLWDYMVGRDDFPAWRAWLHRRGLEHADTAGEFWPSAALVDRKRLAELAYAYLVEAEGAAAAGAGAPTPSEEAP